MANLEQTSLRNQTREMSGFRMPGYDQGAASAFSASMVEGFDNNLTGLSLRAFKYWQIAQDAVQKVNPSAIGQDYDMPTIQDAPPKPKEDFVRLQEYNRSLYGKDYVEGFITKKQFEEAYSLEGALEFKDNYNGLMSEALAKEMVRDYYRDQVNSLKAGLGGHHTARFGGSLVGGFASPIDLAVNIVIPETMFVKWGTGATVASRAGTGVARVASRTVNGAINGEIAAISTLPVIMPLADYNNRPYSLDDAMNQLYLGPAFGATASFLVAGGKRMAFGKDYDNHVADLAMHQGLSGGDPALYQKTAGLSGKLFGRQQSETRATVLLKQESTTPQENAELRVISGEEVPQQLESTSTEKPAAEPAAPATPGDTREGWRKKAHPRAGKYVDDILARKANAKGKQIIETILKDPTDKRIRSALNDDEHFLVEAMHMLFGVDVRFVEANLADRMGFNGFIRGRDPNTIYVRAGQLQGGPAPMIAVVGHEIAHSIRTRDPAMWANMVKSMMDTIGEKDGAVPKAWREVAEKADDNALYTGLTLHQKMDETFAHVLGAAFNDRTFWKALAERSPHQARKLSGYLKGFSDQMVNLLNRGASAKSTKNLYEALAAALHTYESVQLGPAQSRAFPKWRDLTKRTYDQHATTFAEMVDDLSPGLNEAGRERARSLERHQRILNSLFPVVTTFRDESGHPSAPGRFSFNRRVKVKSGNPVHYVINVIFKSTKEGTPQHKLYQTFQEKGVIWSNLHGDGFDAKGRRDYASALRRHSDFPLMEAKQVFKDGQPTDYWDIRIYRDHEFVQWHEVAENGLKDVSPESDLVTEHMYHAEIESMLEVFDQWVGAYKEAVSKDRKLLNKAQKAQRDEARQTKELLETRTFSDYLRTLTSEELDELANSDPNALWQGFVDFIDGKLDPALRETDPNAYKSLAELRQRIDPTETPEEAKARLAGEDNAGARMASRAVLDKEAKRFWKEHKNIKKYMDDRDKVRLQERAILQDPMHSPHLTRDFFIRMFKMERQRIRDTFADTIVTRKGVEGQPDKEVSVTKKMVTDDPAIAKAIDDLALANLAERWPYFREVARLQDVAEKWHMEQLSIETARQIKETVEFEKSKDPNKRKPGWLAWRERLAEEDRQRRESRLRDQGDEEVRKLFGEFEDVAEMSENDVRNPNHSFELYDTDFMAQSTPKDVEEVIRAKVIAQAEAIRLGLDRIHAEAAALQDWVHGGNEKDPLKALQAPIKAADARLKELTAAQGITDWDIHKAPEKPAKGEEAKPAPKLTPTAEALLKDLEEIRDFHLGAQKRLHLFFNKKLTLNPSDWRDAEILDSVARAERLDMGKQATQDWVRAEITRRYQSDALKRTGYHLSVDQLRGLADQSHAKMYSFLDGLPAHFDKRSPFKGTKINAAGQSVAGAINGRVKADTSPIKLALRQVGLGEAFDNNDPVLMKALFLYSKGADRTDPRVKLLFETFDAVNRVQMGRLNREGANIGFLRDFLMTQIHSWKAIRDAKHEFVNDLIAWLDWDRIIREQGYNDSGFEGAPRMNKRKYVEGIWSELSVDRGLPDNWDPITMGGDLSKNDIGHRTLHFLDSKAFDYDMKYGSGNTAGAMMQQLMRRAEASVLWENFGYDYKASWNQVMSEQGLRKMNFTDTLWRADLAFRYLTGDLNHPVDKGIAAFGQATRNYMNSVVAWMTGISSITDLSNISSTLAWAGVKNGGLDGALWRALKENAREDSPNRDFVIGMGAGLESWLHAFNVNQLTEGPLYRFAQDASNTTFEYNGVEFTSRVFQSAFMDLMSQHLGDMARRGATPEFLNWLGYYGISKEMWGQMVKSARDIEGLSGRRLAPDLIQDTQLSEALRLALSDSMHQAILQPSISDRALLTLGTKAGTIHGEAIRTIMQFKSYPMAIARRLWRRFGNAYGNTNRYGLGGFVDRGLVHRLAWMGTSMSFAYVVLAIKDLLRGREPLNPFDPEQYKLVNFMRLTAQAGTGPMAMIEQFSSPSQVLGPAFGTAYNLADQAFTGNTYTRFNAIYGSLPGASIAPATEMQKWVLGHVFKESMGRPYQDMLENLAKERGQSSAYQK